MKKNPNFKGIFVPVITPFNDNGHLYEQRIKNVFEYLQTNNIHGIWLLGSYGGFPLLSERERMQFVSFAVPKAAELNMTVIVNIGSLHTAMATRLAKHAQEHGAHAVASVVPFYYAASHYRDINFLAYFKAIIKSVNLPVFFYNNVKATGFKPQNDFIKKLIDIGVQGFKSKGDHIAMNSEIRSIRAHCRDAVYLSGSTSVHLQGHLLGADGVTSGVALAVPSLVTRLQKALDVNEIDEAARLQELVIQARNVMGRYVGRAVACYDILKDKGVEVGTCRSPWLLMNESQARGVIRDLQEIEEAI
jgi:N-acetylneuraminate lyase/4-hydroxy-tetrahydrodipicolinate synthase